LKRSSFLLSRIALMIVIALPAAFALHVPPFALAQAPPASQSPYVLAARSSGVPLDLLVAVAGAESGYHPWALNIAGRQVYCHSREEAERLLDTSDNVDIGLMQINWPWWGRRLGVSKRDLLDPNTNLTYGARILKECLNRRGSIWHRISDYHSGSAKERDRYNQQVYDTYLRYLRGQIK
jgi:soluble lytic murein transglycosylase-like protein